ncbi:conserved hypothetical protein [Bradyrhizobium sp. ORS 285]|nr:conserved hypothetical protein [Bradyrhizobium sp. ORS 285]
MCPVNTSRAAAPHPNPLPVKNGERERTAGAATESLELIAARRR